ncbi:MAG: hypothetical protein ABIQ16_04595 [Polyangiaceae bacterium]
MKYLLMACGVAVLCAACRQTTSPSVPKVAIEKAADTKIEDAGTADEGR